MGRFLTFYGKLLAALSPRSLFIARRFIAREARLAVAAGVALAGTAMRQAH
jgi:hypothetical protein